MRHHVGRLGPFGGVAGAGGHDDVIPSDSEVVNRFDLAFFVLDLLHRLRAVRIDVCKILGAILARDASNTPRVIQLRQDLDHDPRGVLDRFCHVVDEVEIGGIALALPCVDSAPTCLITTSTERCVILTRRRLDVVRCLHHPLNVTRRDVGPRSARWGRERRTVRSIDRVVFQIGMRRVVGRLPNILRALRKTLRANERSLRSECHMLGVARGPEVVHGLSIHRVAHETFDDALVFHLHVDAHDTNERNRRPGPLVFLQDLRAADNIAFDDVGFNGLRAQRPLIRSQIDVGRRAVRIQTDFPRALGLVPIASYSDRLIGEPRHRMRLIHVRHSRIRVQFLEFLLRHLFDEEQEAPVFASWQLDQRVIDDRCRVAHLTDEQVLLERAVIDPVVCDVEVPASGSHLPERRVRHRDGRFARIPDATHQPGKDFGSLFRSLATRATSVALRHVLADLVNNLVDVLRQLVDAQVRPLLYAPLRQCPGWPLPVVRRVSERELHVFGHALLNRPPVLLGFLKASHGLCVA